MANILVIDDDRAIRLLVSRGLTAAGFQVQAVGTAEQGLEIVRRATSGSNGDHSDAIDVALIDVYLPEMNGLELYSKLRALDRKLPIIFITSDNSSETTIEAMRLGAFDYLSKPLNLEQLRELTASAAAARWRMDQPVAMSLGQSSKTGEQFVGRSPAMVDVFKSIGRVAEQDVSVLVRGESGSGKELVARAIVQHSLRCDKPFVAVNCAAIPDQLLESELFGVEKGAYTGADQRRRGKFEHCDGGTLFLDEIGDMSWLVQGKILRVMQEQKFQRLGGNSDIATDVRIIAATHRDLEQLIERGEFREDLFYRLNGMTIQLTPLRQRREDIPPLLEYFLNRARADMNKTMVEGLAPAALDALVAYDWPGNIRQLQSVVRQAMLSTTGTVVDLDSLPEFIVAGASAPATSSPATSTTRVATNGGESATSGPIGSTASAASAEPVAALREQPAALPGEQPAAGATAGHGGEPSSWLHDFIEQRIGGGSEDLYAEAVDELEKYLFQRVLSHTGGNQSQAARILGITRGKVRDRIAKFELPG